MRGYSIGPAALALQVDSKWLDNLLSQNRVEGVAKVRQGIQRRIAPAALYVIDTAHGLNRDFQIPVTAALKIAHELWQDYGDSGFDGDSGSDDVAMLQVGEMALKINRRAIRARIEAALAEALEMAPRTKRGRPRQK